MGSTSSTSGHGRGTSVCPRSRHLTVTSPQSLGLGHGLPLQPAGSADQAAHRCKLVDSAPARLVWIICALLAGLLLVFTIPVSVYPKRQEVRIQATDEKDPASQGSEVWLNNIRTGQADFPVDLQACTGNWDRIGSSLVYATGSAETTLICTIYTSDSIRLFFGQHGWSGSVQVLRGDENRWVDLYSTTGGVETVELRANMSPGDRLVWLLLLFAHAGAYGFGLLTFAIRLISLPDRVDLPRPIRPWRSIGFSLPLVSVWSIYLLAYWPGFFPGDSVDQFSQIIAGSYNNWHPAMHTLLLKAITYGWFSPAPVIILQIVAMAGVIGLGASMLEGMGLPGWACWSIILFLTISPAAVRILLSPWKDAPYSIALVGLALLILHYLDRAS